MAIKNGQCRVFSGGCGLKPLLLECRDENPHEVRGRGGGAEHGVSSG